MLAIVILSKEVFSAYDLSLKFAVKSELCKNVQVLHICWMWVLKQGCDKQLLTVFLNSLNMSFQITYAKYETKFSNNSCLDLQTIISKKFIEKPIYR